MARQNKKVIPISEAVDEADNWAGSLVEFRKSNDSIGLRVVEGRFSLLSRKLYNLFISTAQIQKKPGVDAPINDASAESYFWIALQDVIKDTKYNSNDYETLKEHAHELQNIRVEAESDKMWTSERLLSGVKIYNSRGLKSKGGTVWLGFSFPPEVLQIVLNPTIYTKFSLWYQTQLSTASSLAMYEVCRRYASSPSHLTNREKWERWFYTITGTATTDSNLPQYKYFKRDHLLKSIAEINAITDIDIELLEFKDGRKVAELQFKVYQKAQASFELPSAPIINMAIIDRIMALGISKDEATSTYTSYAENVVLAHLELVESRQKNVKIGSLDSPAAYFKAAIKNGYANSIVADITGANVTPTKKKKNLRERFLIARAKDAHEFFQTLQKDEKDELIRKFSKTADKSIRPYLKKGLEMALVRKAFGAWYATELWGEPTDANIIDFLELESEE